MFLSLAVKGSGAEALSYLAQKHPGKVYSSLRMDAWNTIKRLLIPSDDPKVQVRDQDVAELRGAFDAMLLPPHDPAPFVAAAEVRLEGDPQCRHAVLSEVDRLCGSLRRGVEQTTVFFPVYGPEAVNMVACTEFPEYKLWEAGTPNAEAYVTSREYAVSSLFCREIKRTFHTSVKGAYPNDSAAREWASKPLDLQVELLPVVTRLSDEEIKGLFRPLGYSGVGAEGVDVAQRTMIVDHGFSHEWMPRRTRVLGVMLSGRVTLRDFLRHILVLIPVMDNETHYQELDPLVAELKLLGDDWLGQHPMRDFISTRFLRYRKRLIQTLDVAPEAKTETPEEAFEKRVGLGVLRRKWFVQKVLDAQARSVVDAGCGSGRLAEDLAEARVLEILACDCSPRSVRHAERFLKGKAQVFFSSLMYYDEHLLNKDTICLQEVIEHMPSDFQLARALELIFGAYRPKLVLMSTPNRDYNVRLGLKPGEFRHSGHRFEFDSDEVQRFVQGISDKYHYRYQIEGIGEAWVPPLEARGEAPIPAEPGIGAPTFGLVFGREVDPRGASYS